MPLSVTQSENIRSIREWANLRAVSATLVRDRTYYETEETKKVPDDTKDIYNKRGGRAIDF